MNAMAQVKTEPAGLFWKEGSRPVPLEGVKVHADVAAHASRVRMTQRFRNAETVPIEAVYVFPLPEAAAVCGFAMQVGDRRLEGEVEPRDKAFERYDEAMAAGDGAALLDQERPNVFTLSVGNILPGQQVAIELTWVAELKMEGEAIRFMLPTTVAPRYAPEEDRRGVSPTAADRVSPPVEFEVPYGLELDVDVLVPSGIAGLDSPSHPVRFDLDGTRAHVSLSHGSSALDRDFVLLITPREAGAPQVLVERNDDGLVTAAVSFVPRLEAGTARSEVIFLVDRSGSMGGSSIEQVRAALHLCLRSLHPGDRFNIVGFGSDFCPLFPEAVTYEQETLARASEHVDSLDADMGGTEILPALRSVVEREPHAGLRRQVVLLTDGEVSNEAAVIELAEEHSADTRIFTFGIGYGASEHLVRSVARVTRGEAEFIHPGERIEPKVLRQFSRIGTPAVREVQVEWAGADVTLQAPHRPPSIFNGEAGMLYARFGQPRGQVTVTLRGQAEGKEVSRSLPVDAAAAEPGQVLATLAARAAIRDLEEGTSALHDERRGSAQRGRREDAVKMAIVALATTYRLASRETSFVAIEKREEGAAEQPAAELRRVPVALTKGWGGVDRGRLSYVASRVLAAAPFSDVRYCLSLRDDMLEGPSSPMAAPEDVILACQSSVASSPASSRATGTRASRVPLHIPVIVLQQADGSWRLDAALARELGIPLAELRALAESVGDGSNCEPLVATLAALCFLRERAWDACDQWRLLAEKAEEWLAAALATLPAGARAGIERQVAALL